LINAFANRKDETTSQIIASEKPDKASPSDTVLVMVAKLSAIMETAPIGRGFRMNPAMTATNIANKCQVTALSPTARE
jgi:hypothetical protein